MKKASMSKMTKAPKKMMKSGGTSMKKYAKKGTVTTGDPLERLEKKKKKVQAREEIKQMKTEAKQSRKVTRAEGSAVADEILTGKKERRARRAGNLISRVRSSERNVNVRGDRRLFGNNSRTENVDNSTTIKSTTTTSGSNAGGGAGGSSGSSSRSGSSSGSSSRAMQKQEQRDMRKNNSDNKSNSNVGGIQSKGVGNQKKGGISKTKMMKGETTMAKKKMMTGGMTNPNKSASVAKSATKYTGGKNGTMMMKGGTTKKKMMYGSMSKKKK